MPLSMTGYGRGQASSQELSVTVELRGINSRYCEVSLRLPPGFQSLDAELRRRVSDAVVRGKVDLTLSCRDERPDRHLIRADLPRAAAYATAARAIAETVGATPNWRPDPMAILRLPDVIVAAADDDEPDSEVTALLDDALMTALDELEAMRRAEGERLADDIREKLVSIRSQLALIEAALPDIETRYRERLEQRLERLLTPEAWARLGPERIATEVAVLAERSAIDEELVRLQSHLEQFTAILDADEEQVGKKLDFLIQEMNREINTIGSKVQEIAVSSAVIEVKALLEKIREQVQNLV
ncbi:MAG: YicC/YloC family endoribonuclease [Bacillota bacterium]|nr:YicC/YloC family endoribonuclease [Bacillota bacterium]